MIKSNENMILEDLEKDEIRSEVEKKFKEILKTLKFDVDNDQNLVDTPKRWSKMMVDELLAGCYTPEPEITVFDNTKKYDKMVFLGPIKIKSLCSHHVKSFVGEAFLAYIPKKKVVGISKLARIIQWFMRRMQLQEELTKQILDFIIKRLKPKGAAVFIEAQHLCMTVRGVEEPSAMMTTSALYGSFKKSKSTKEEFFNIIALKRTNG